MRAAGRQYRLVSLTNESLLGGISLFSSSGKYSNIDTSKYTTIPLFFHEKSEFHHNYNIFPTIYINTNTIHYLDKNVNFHASSGNMTECTFTFFAQGTDVGDKFKIEHLYAGHFQPGELGNMDNKFKLVNKGGDSKLRVLCISTAGGGNAVDGRNDANSQLEAIEWFNTKGVPSWVSRKCCINTPKENWLATPKQSVYYAAIGDVYVGGTALL